jgi:NAD(P)H-hydrate epimerase
LLPPGRGLTGSIEVADIGLDVSGASSHLVEDADIAVWVPERPADAHKWKAAVWVVAGSPGMAGAAHLSARAAQRAGAGYVRLSTPGLDDDPIRPTEAVGLPLPAAGWDRDVLAGLDRFAALVVGPGLGTGEASAAAAVHVAAAAPIPVVVDGDGLTALGRDAASIMRGREIPAVLTPHDGEYERLAGHPPGTDRLAAARELATALGSVVLLKGPTTVAAAPDGRVLVVTAGDQRLASAGTGDVLSGLVGAFCARGAPPFEAAAAAAHVHGRAATLGWPTGLVAGDLPDLIPPALGRSGRPPAPEGTSA